MRVLLSSSVQLSKKTATECDSRSFSSSTRLLDLFKGPPGKLLYLGSRLSALDPGAIEKTSERQMKQVDHYLEQAKASGRIADMVRVLRGGQTLAPTPKREPSKVILANDDLA